MNIFGFDLGGDEKNERKILLAILAVTADIRDILKRPAGPAYVQFTVNNQSLVLLPNRKNVMALTKLSIGHNAVFSITFLDQNGNPMLTPTTPDSVPTWSNTTPATETITVAGDGLSAQGTTVAVGTDTVSVVAVVGGVTFNASADIEVDAAPQVVTSARLDVAVV